MIKFHELKVGDYVMAEYEGQQRRGEVTRLSPGDQKAQVETDVQDFWYEQQHLYPIPINDDTLKELNFTREEQEDGTVKYKKGSFRILIPVKGNFSALEMWYREDRRHQPDVHYIHQLQNQYLQMTKIHLTKEVMV